MKKCLVCGWSGNAVTCPKCGEASWSAVQESPAPVVGSGESNTNADGEKPARRRRSS